VKKEQNGRKSLRRLKPAVGCNASKRRRRKVILKKKTRRLCNDDYNDYDDL
jgi:hypothetical protein